MNKAELVSSIADKTNLSKKDSEVTLNAVISSIQEALVSDDKVVLVGFGTFEVRKRAQRKGRDPQTKKEIIIPASNAPVFKAGKSLKESVNK